MMADDQTQEQKSEVEKLGNTDTWRSVVEQTCEHSSFLIEDSVKYAARSYQGSDFNSTELDHELAKNKDQVTNESKITTSNMCCDKTVVSKSKQITEQNLINEEFKSSEIETIHKSAQRSREVRTSDTGQTSFGNVHKILQSVNGPAQTHMKDYQEGFMSSSCGNLLHSNKTVLGERDYTHIPLLETLSPTCEFFNTCKCSLDKTTKVKTCGKKEKQTQHQEDLDISCCKPQSNIQKDSKNAVQSVSGLKNKTKQDVYVEKEEGNMNHALFGASFQMESEKNNNFSIQTVYLKDCTNMFQLDGPNLNFLKVNDIIYKELCPSSGYQDRTDSSVEDNSENLCFKDFQSGYFSKILDNQNNYVVQQYSDRVPDLDRHVSNIKPTHSRSDVSGTESMLDSCLQINKFKISTKPLRSHVLISLHKGKILKRYPHHVFEQKIPEKENKVLESLRNIRMLRDWKYFMPVPPPQCCLPVLRDYFDQLEQGAVSQENSMNYEWLRLATLRGYCGGGSLIQLARNGFFHDPAYGPQATRCYACRLLYTSWEYLDDIVEIHRKLSPNCPFVCADASSGNIAIDNIYNAELTTTEAVGPLQDRSIPAYESLSQVVNSVRNITNTLDDTHIREMVPGGGSQLPIGDHQNSRSASGSELPTSHASGYLGTNTTNNNISIGVTSTATGTKGPIGTRLNDPLQVEVVNPKHQDFISVDSRAASFTSMWPSYLDQTPRQMAEAGFFYTGVSDFTRCFACGGGLRNWEAGDDPCLEHTRWYPRCEYMNKLKGSIYIQAVMRRQEQHVIEQRRREQQRRQTQSQTHMQTDPMTIPAAAVLIEMGYPRAQVRDAIITVRGNLGYNSVSAQQVLIWILDQEEDARSPVTTQEPSKAQRRIPNQILAPTTSTSDPISQSQGSNGQGHGASKAGAYRGSGFSSPRGKVNNGGENRYGDETEKTKDTQSLKAENQKLRELQTCKICMDNPVNMTLLPCGHLVCCESCAPHLRKCPICRKKIDGSVKTFMA